MTIFGRLRAKEFFLFSAVFAVALACGFPNKADAKTKRAPQENNKYASIVMDADTGMVLSQANADKPLHPASLTKIMTLELLFEALDNGQLSLRDRIPVSRHAASMVPSKLDLPAGSSIKVQDAIYGIVTKSANDVAVAIAERLGGSEANFARMMTRRARELGMENTNFVNASGLHDPRQVSSARDMATLARFVINQHPGYYRYYSTANFTFQGKTYHTHNRLMETYKGMDGMKTGYVGPSGFNLVASAVQKDHRLIGVVFGGKSTASRNSHMAALLDRGFDRVGDIRIAKANTQQAPVPATKPLVSDKELIAANAITSPSPSSGITAAALNPANDAPPVPPKKPAILVAINTLNKAAPGEVKLASLAPVVDPDKFGELVGEGDIDPAETRRIETGLVAASAIRGEELKNERMLTAPTADDTWSIQIGAYSSRATSDQAIHAAAKKLPVALSGNPAIAPLKIKDGWVFRARLGGYSREEAFQACKYVKDCMPVAPQNN